MLLVIKSDEKLLNTLLYEVALYNFSQFMIKDFDLKKIAVFGQDQSALQISGFENLAEAEWYYGMLKKNADLMQILTTNNVEVIRITQSNLQMIGKEFSLDDYLEWQQTAK